MIENLNKRGLINLIFSEEITNDLRYNSRKAYGTEINDLLLTALGMAVKSVTKQNAFHIDMEGHGRESIHKSIIVDRTVGWFTNPYPIMLEIKYDEIGKNIIHVKETIRKIPNKGLGYGVIKLNDNFELSDERPDIGYNYFGVIKKIGDSENKDDIVLADLSCGDNIADENGAINNNISINGEIRDKKLIFNIYYNKAKFDDDFMERLKNCFQTALVNIIDHCKGKINITKTASDFGAVHMDEFDFEEIIRQVAAEEIEEIYSLSPMQEGMLYHKLVDEDSTNYLIQLDILMTGEVKLDTIREAIELLSIEHESLRTAIIYKKISIPMQVVLKNRKIETIEFDISKVEDEQERNNQLEKIKNRDLKRGFDLQSDSLLRILIVKEKVDQIRIIWSFHHIIIDGWCLNFINKSFVNNYKILQKGIKQEELCKILFEQYKNSVHYAEYIKWLNQQDKEEALTYFENMLDGYENIIKIPSNGEALKSEASVDEIFTEENNLMDKLKNFSSSYGITMSTIIETAWGILLQKYNFCNDVVFGKVVSGRNIDINNIDKCVGLFINTIPTRVLSTEKMTFLELARIMQQQNIDSSKYEHCPLAEIQNSTMQKENLINILYVFENYYFDKSENTNIENVNMEFTSYREEVNYDILLTSGYMKEKLYFKLAYNPSLYDREEISLLVKRLENILIQSVDMPNVEISDIEILSSGEQKKISEFNNTYREYDFEKTIAELIEDQVEKTPDKIAIVFENTEITYREFNNKANRLARKMRSYGIKAGDYVGVMVERSIEMIIAVVAVIKSGGAYVPIDPKFPRDRRKYMVEDCNLKILLSSPFIVEDMNLSEDIIYIDVFNIDMLMDSKENLEKINTRNDKLYMIYTSGSTGKAKGVVIEHKTMLNLVYWELYDCVINLSSNVLLSTTICFDVASQEIISALAGGATSYLIMDELKKDTKAVIDYIKEKKINMMFTTPSYFDVLTSEQYGIDVIYETMTDVVLAGEAFYINDGILKDVRKGNIRFHNNYGPTETHVVTNNIHAGSKNNSLSIGKPISNTAIYILNGLKQCGIGIPGELCITGVGVARGYHNRDELTNEKFIDNPYGEGKLYRTGDLAKWLLNGNIEYLGRMDEQVKIRGFRIELGEIENTIRKNKKVKDVAVIAKGQQVKTICAYLVSEEKIDLLSEKKELEKDLPDYMIPLMMQIDKLPLTSNGKLDRKKLPNIENEVCEMYLAPRNIEEEKLIEIFKEILDIDRIGIKDNFFVFGGHSLKAMRLINSIEKEFSVRIPFNSIFKYPTVEKLCDVIKNQKKSIYEKIKKAKDKEYYAMSASQKRMYFINRLDKNSLAYNMPMAVNYPKGILNFNKIKDVFEKLVNRHDALRTCFYMLEGEPIQKICNKVNLDIKYLECANFDIQEYIEEFDLEKAPLFRVRLIEEKDNSILFVDMHHIISDGRSCDILFEEFNKLYEGKQLEELKLQYKDYSELINNKNLQSQEKYWIGKFQDQIPILSLPLDYVRPKLQSHHGKTISRAIGDDLREKVAKFALDNETTEFIILLSCAMILLQQYSQQDDILIGTPVSGRTHKDTENIMGLFVNTLVIRGNPEKRKKYTEFLSELKEDTLNAYDNQDYPFDQLVEKVDIERDLSRNPLFDVLFTFQNKGKSNISITDKIAKEMNDKSTITHFDLSISVIEVNNMYLIGFEYCKDLFSEDTMKIMMQHYINIVNFIIDNPEERIEQISILDRNEKDIILNVFNKTDTEYPRDKTVVELFEKEVEENPEKTAVVHKDRKLTYKELNVKANQLALKLRNQGLNTEDCVAIVANKKIETIVGILAILKVGAAYVPLESNYPIERLQYMIKDSKVKAILMTDEKNIECDDIWKINLCDENIFEGDCSNHNVKLHPDNISYIIYTSGTTGNPKGVIVTHKNIVRLVKNTNYLEFEGVKILQTGSLSFDASTFEIWGTLLNGGSLYLIDKEDLMNADKVKETINRNKINTLFLTVALYNQLIKDNDTTFDGLESIFIGGEKLSKQHIQILRNHNKKICMYNVYGPTENTTFSTTYKIREVGNKAIPIGKPLANTKIYIMNETTLCGIGVPGELCTAGDGVARGYLNSPELTEEKFIDNPFGEGKLYRTGDLAKWNADGDIEFLGRIDDQVKIRGFRIELAEIENAIKKIENIKDASAIVRGDVDKILCAYLVSEEKLDMEQIKEKLAEELPDYMIPILMQIDGLPLDKNGKVEKNKLPKIEYTRTVEYIASRNEKERILVEIFEEVLGIKDVSIKDSFFELGGDSIKAIRIASKLKDYGYEVEIKHILISKTVESISNELVPISKIISNYQGEALGELALTVMQEEIVKNSEYENISYFLQADSLDEKIVRKVFEKIVKCHNMMRAVYSDNNQVILNGNEKKFFELRVFDLTRYNADETKTFILKEKIKSEESTNFSEKPLFKGVLFKTTEKDHLLIVVSNFISDSYSLKILLKDFINGYLQYEKSKEITLQKEKTGFIKWVDLLNNYENSEKYHKNIQFWSMMNSQVTQISLPFENNTDLDDVFENERILFANGTMRNIIEYSGKVSEAKIDAILVTALQIAIGNIFSIEKIPMFITTLNRSFKNLNYDFSNTVGNFVCKYPVVLKKQKDIYNNICTIQKLLGEALSKCITYEVLKSKNKVEITFDTFAYQCLDKYMGMYLEDRDEEDFYICESVFQDKVLKHNNKHILYFEPKVKADELFVDISYNKNKIRKELIEKLKTEIEVVLDDILKFCKDTSINNTNLKKEYVSKEIIKYVDNINNEEVEAKYKPTNMQNYFLKVRNFAPVKFELKENHAEEDIVKALNILINRHSVLRTAYDLEYMIEYTHRQNWYIPILDFTSTCTDENNHNNILNELCKNYEYSKNTLINRMFVLKKPGKIYEIKMFIQHAIWDSMSSEMFEKSFNEIISLITKGQEVPYANDKFSDFIKQIRQNMNYSKIQTKANDKLIAGMKDFVKTYNSTNRIQYVYARLNLTKEMNTRLNDKAITFSAKLLDKNLQCNNNKIEENLPVSVLFHGRNKSNEQCLGLYLVLIPLLRHKFGNNLEKQFSKIRKNFDIYEAHLISEYLFQYLPNEIEIPMYINFKNIFTLSDENTKLLNIKKVDIHSIVDMNDTLGVELMIMDNIVHVIFPAFTKDKAELINLIEEVLTEM